MSVRSKGSKSSHASTTSSKAKARALEAKAKHAELQARIAQLDQVEAAKKEAERVRLTAESAAAAAAAAAIGKVYEDAIKEENEQYLGSDDPDNDEKETKEKGNFHLTKFVSNDRNVLAVIPAEERTIKNLDLDKLPIERALGLQWDIETDTFGVKVSLLPKPFDDDARRGCLSTLSYTFDLLGILGQSCCQLQQPFICTQKGQERELCKRMQNTWQF